MKITVNVVNGEPLSFSAVKPPWQWRDFLVIDTVGNGVLTYVPLSMVESFTVPAFEAAR
jgi:hypothetical protein